MENHCNQIDVNMPGNPKDKVDIKENYGLGINKGEIKDSDFAHTINKNNLTAQGNKSPFIQGNDNNVDNSQESINVTVNVIKNKSRTSDNCQKDEEYEIGFVISGTAQRKDKTTLKAIEKHLNSILGTTSLTIYDIDEGSIKLFLNGTQEDLEKLENAFKSGELKDIFDIPIEDVNFVGDSKQKLALTIAGDVSYTDIAKLKSSLTGVDTKDILVQKIRSNRDGKILNLAKANLSDANLSDVNITEVNLSGADLNCADLSSANLSGADLSGADLSGADLSDVDLSGANLSDVDLSSANLSGANLSGADLSGADLSDVDLSGADLSDVDLSGANLSDVDLNFINPPRKSRNDKSNDDLLYKAIGNFISETPGSRKWDSAFAKLWSMIKEYKILPTSTHPNYPDLLQDIQLEFSRKISSVFKQIIEEEKPLVHSLRLWISYSGLGLRYKILDLYRKDNERSRREISLNKLDILTSRNNELNIAYLTLDDFEMSNLSLIESNFSNLIEPLIQSDLSEKLLAKIQNLDCHSRKYPQCTCVEIYKRRFLKIPPQNLEEIANELSIPLRVVTSHWHRKCKPLLREIYNELLAGQYGRLIK